MKPLFRYGLSCAAVLAFFGIFAAGDVLSLEPDRVLLIALFMMPMFAALLWLAREGTLFSSGAWAAGTIAVFFAGAFIRIYCLPHVTLDYTNFLSVWMDYFDKNGLEAFKMSFSDYNMPYLYFLYGLSKAPVDWLFSIKWLSVACDLLLMLTGMATVRHFNKSPRYALITMALLWLGPTIWLNSSFWGQCDVIYALLALLALLMIYKDKPWVSMAFAALAFSFKLQTVFFLPVYLIFLIAKKIKWKHFLAFPAVYFVSILPALILGKPLGDIIGVYGGQVKQYSGYLNLNSPSGYALLGNDPPAFVSTLGIVCAALLICVVYTLCLSYREKLDDKLLLFLTFFLCAGIPWLLPSMHDRYFYLADMFVLLCVVVSPKRWPAAILCTFGSYGGYHAYLFGKYLTNGQLILPSVAMLTSIIIIAFEIHSRFHAIPAASLKRVVKKNIKGSKKK